MMRYIVAGVIIVCALLVLWPILLAAGRKLRSYFEQANKSLEGGDSKIAIDNPPLQRAKKQRTKKTTSKKTTSKKTTRKKSKSTK